MELRKLIKKDWDSISNRLASTKKGAIDSVLRAGKMFEQERTLGEEAIEFLRALGALRTAEPSIDTEEVKVLPPEGEEEG